MGGDERSGDVRLLISGYGPADFVPLDSLGGEAHVVSSDPTEHETRLSALLALCNEWEQLENREAAGAWIATVMPALGMDELIDFNDVALTSSTLLSDIAETLEVGWTALSADTTSRGNVALEGWARLALGGWTASTLSLRAALAMRAAKASTEEVEADIFLVRTLGAALDQWPDPEVASALERLSSIEDVECDVAYELGMRDLRRAVEAQEPSDAAAALEDARQLFTRANEEGVRPDAAAFDAACAAVASFIRGESVLTESVITISEAVADWYSGYLGLPPHWRQARAQTGGAWAALVLDLQAVGEVHEPSWLDPMQLLADVGRIYVSHNSSTLIAKPTTPPAEFDDLEAPATQGISPMVPVASGGVAVALGPVLDASLAASSNTQRLVAKWLAAVGEAPPENTALDEVSAIAAALERIRSMPPPGKGGASRDQPLPETLREALEDVLDRATYEKVVGAVSAHLSQKGKEEQPEGAAFPSLTLNQDLVLLHLTKELAALRPEEVLTWGPQLNLFLTVLVRAATLALDQEQGGQKALPWHSKVEDGKKSPEHHLADFLCWAFALSGLSSYVEVPNAGGGRADVLVQIGTERLVIEVKRVTAKRTSGQLTSEFGPQAAQYTITGAPFAFLAVLDNARHTSHLDLFGSFWVDEWVDPTNEVKRPLVGLRVLTNVPPPSEISKTPKKDR